MLISGPLPPVGHSAAAAFGVRRVLEYLLVGVGLLAAVGALLALVYAVFDDALAGLRVIRLGTNRTDTPQLHPTGRTREWGCRPAPATPLTS